MTKPIARLIYFAFHSSIAFISSCIPSFSSSFFPPFYLPLPPLFKVLRIPILRGSINSSEHSQPRNAWGVGSFSFNNFLLCFKIKLTVALARKHIIFYICVCLSVAGPLGDGPQLTNIAPKGKSSYSQVLTIVFPLI